METIALNLLKARIERERVPKERENTDKNYCFSLNIIQYIYFKKKYEDN